MATLHTLPQAALAAKRSAEIVIPRMTSRAGGYLPAMKVGDLKVSVQDGATA
jgi:hypothetical protein